MTTIKATNQPLNGPLAKPAGRSFLNDALDAATNRRTGRIPWITPDEDAEPVPGEESRKQMSAEVRAAAGYGSTDTEGATDA